MKIYHVLNVLLITRAFSFIIHINVLFTGCIAHRLLQITFIPIGYAIGPTNRCVFFRAFSWTFCQIIKILFNWINMQCRSRLLLVVQLRLTLLTPVGISFPTSHISSIRFASLGLFWFLEPLTRNAYTDRIFYWMEAWQWSFLAFDYGCVDLGYWSFIYANALYSITIIILVTFCPALITF